MAVLFDVVKLGYIMSAKAPSPRAAALELMHMCIHLLEVHWLLLPVIQSDPFFLNKKKLLLYQGQEEFFDFPGKFSMGNSLLLSSN